MEDERRVPVSENDPGNDTEDVADDLFSPTTYEFKPCLTFCLVSGIGLISLSQSLCVNLIVVIFLQFKFDHSKGVAVFGSIMAVVLLVASCFFAATLGRYTTSSALD